MNSWKAIYNGTQPSPATKKIVVEFSKGLSVLDYGSGKGRNTLFLHENKFNVFPYEPNYDKISNHFVEHDFIDYKNIKDGYYDIVLCSYVINVLKPYARDELIKKLFKLKWTYLILETRDKVSITTEATKNDWRWYADGYITNRETFQCGFDLSSMRELLYKNTKSTLYTNIYTKSHGNISLKIENLDELHQNFYKKIFKHWPKKGGF